MFLESVKKQGWIEVVCGSMFSGKTEELIRRMKRATFANQKVEIFKPSIDTRYSESDIVSHDRHSIRSTPVKDSSEIMELSEGKDVIGIDEAQFFDMGIIDVCRYLAANGKRVIVAGLDMDYLGNPFGPMPLLMAVAEYVTKVHAICVKCGDPANHSYRLSQSEELVLLGEKETYQPLCRHCFNEAMKNADIPSLFKEEVENEKQ